MKALRVSLIAIAVCIGLGLAGCGQKGNLYLPNQKKKVPTPTTQPDSQTQPSGPPADPAAH